MRKFISIGCVVLGVFLLAYPSVKNRIEDARQKALLEAFVQMEDIEIPENSTSVTIEENPKATNSPEAVVDENDVDEKELALLDGARGILRIPGIDMEMLIFEGATADSLEKGAGMIEPKKEFDKDNVGLAGHRSVTYGRRFNRLGEIKRSDIMEVWTSKAIYEYEVTEILTVDRSETGVLADEKEPLLTLVTCTPVGKKNPAQRLIVQGRLVQVTQLE